MKSVQGYISKFANQAGTNLTQKVVEELHPQPTRGRE